MPSWNQTIGWSGVVPFLLLIFPCALRGVAAPPASEAQTTQPGTTPPVVAKTAGSVAPSRLNAPASLQEAASIIDFRTFPALERDKLLHQSAVKIGYTLAKPDLTKDVQFYRDKFTEAGWKIEYDKVDPKLAFGTFRCSNQGFVVDVTICQDPNNKKMQVFLENQGNIDARAIPRPPGAEVTQSQPNVTIFRTNAKPAEVGRFVRTELKPLGWREAVYPNMPDDESEDYLVVGFIQRGMHINANINVKDGKTEAMYSVSMLKVGLPIMPDAKGRIQYSEEPFLHLGYATPSPPDAVLEFYRKELPALGWSIRPGTDKIEDGKAKVALEGPDKEPLRLELLNKGGPTLVLIANRPDGNADTDH